MDPNRYYIFVQTVEKIRLLNQIYIQEPKIGRLF